MPEPAYTVRKFPGRSSHRPGNLPSVAHSQPLHVQGSGRKPIRQTRVPAASIFRTEGRQAGDPNTPSPASGEGLLRPLPQLADGNALDVSDAFS